MAWIEFQGRIEPMVWGDKVYTVLPLPAPAVQALGDAARVEGEIDEHPVNLAITRGGPIDGPYLWAGRSLLDRLGAEPGQPLWVRLRPAPPDAVETPPDVQVALAATGLGPAWDAARPGQRRGWLHRIATAKRPDTRARRIAEVLDRLRDGTP